MEQLFSPIGHLAVCRVLLERTGVSLPLGDASVGSLLSKQARR